jgi:hypothetical protein
MTAGQYYHRAGMWLLLSALFLRHAFRDSISDGWMGVLSILFLIYTLVLCVTMVIVDRNARRSTIRR